MVKVSSASSDINVLSRDRLEYTGSSSVLVLVTATGSTSTLTGGIVGPGEVVRTEGYLARKNAAIGE